MPVGGHPPPRSHTQLPRLGPHCYTPWWSRLSVCHDRSARHCHREDRTLRDGTGTVQDGGFVSEGY